MPHHCTNCERTFPDGSKEMLSGCPDCGGNKFQFVPPDATGGTGTAESGGTATGSARERPDSTSDRGSSGAWPETARRPAEKDRPGYRADRPSSITGSAPGADPAAAPTATEAADPVDSTDAGGPRAPRSEETPGRTEGTAPPTGRDAEPITGERAGVLEDDAQADARSAVVEPDDLLGLTADPATRREDSPSTAARDGTRGHPSNGDPQTGHASSTDEGSGDGSGDLADDGGTDAGGSPADEPAETPSLEDLREELNEQFESIRIVEPGQYELNLMELYDREEYIVSLQEDGRYVIDVPESWREADGQA